MPVFALNVKLITNRPDCPLKWLWPSCETSVKSTDRPCTTISPTPYPGHVPLYHLLPTLRGIFIPFIMPQSHQKNIHEKHCVKIPWVVCENPVKIPEWFVRTLSKSPEWVERTLSKSPEWAERTLSKCHGLLEGWGFTLTEALAMQWYTLITHPV